MIDNKDYKIYLEKIGFAGNSLNTYPSYISQNNLDNFPYKFKNQDIIIMKKLEI